MEKMRRARINDSLNEMKNLVLDLLNKDVSTQQFSDKATNHVLVVAVLKSVVLVKAINSCPRCF